MMTYDEWKIRPKEIALTWKEIEEEITKLFKETRWKFNLKIKCYPHCGKMHENANPVGAQAINEPK